MMKKNKWEVRIAHGQLEGAIDAGTLSVQLRTMLEEELRQLLRLVH